jgi:uncharacterized protein YutE (UPF0331/DUF86 family)
LVDRFIVDARIAKIREYVALLRKIYGQAEEKTFVKDPLVYGNAERYLQLTIQCVIDISNHIIADLRLNLPSDNRQLFEMLAQHKILTKTLANKLTAMAGFRNILVHEYLEIDRRRVYAVLKSELGDFEKFIRSVSKLL